MTELNEEQINNLARSLIATGGHLTFASQVNRNAVAKRCRENRTKVIRSSIRNQLLDPRYVVDSGVTEDRGLGNDYKHYWSVLYKLERDRSW